MSPRIPHEFILALLLWLLGLMRGEEARAGEPAQPPPASATRRYTIATGFLQRDLPELALAEYQGLLRDHPNFEQRDAARYGLAVAAYRLKQFDVALEALAPLADAKQFELRPDALLLLGQCAASLRRHAEAEPVLAALLAEFPNHAHAPEAAALRVEVLRRTERNDDCLQSADAFLEKHAAAPQAERVSWIAAEAALAKGDHRDAAARFDRFSERFATSTLLPRARLLAGQCHARAGALDAAERPLRTAAQSDDAEIRATALQELVSLYLRGSREDDADRAAADFQKQFSDHPGAPAMRLTRGQLAARRGDKDAAQRLLAGAESAPDRRSADRALASLALRDGEYADAARLLEKLVAEAGDRAAYADRLDFANALLRIDRAPDALSYLDILLGAAGDRALEAPSADLRAWALELRANAHWRLKRFAKAAADARRFRADFPDSPRAPEVAALEIDALASEEKHEEVASLAPTLLAKTENTELRRRVVTRLGFSLIRLGRVDEALPHLRETAQATDDAQTRAAALSALGQIALDRKDWPAAEAAWRGAAEAAGPDSNPEAARLRLGIALARQERFEEALSALARFADQSIDTPDREHAAYERARCLTHLKRTAEAREEFERLLRARPDSPFFASSASELARLLTDAGETKQAAAWLAKAAEKAEDRSQKARLTIAAARARLDAGDAEAAAKLLAELRTSTADAPLREEASALLALTHAARGRCDDLLSLSGEEGSRLMNAGSAIAARATFEIARCLAAAKRADDAQRAFECVAAGNADAGLAVLARIELAKLDIEAARWPAASARLAKLDLAPIAEAERKRTESIACYYRAFCASRQEDPQTAAREAKRCLDLKPPAELAAPAARLAAEALLATADPAAAIPLFESLLNDSLPDDQAAPLRLRLAEALAAAQQWRRAEDAYQTFLTSHGKHPLAPQARFGVGWSREQQQRYPEAIESYRSVADSGTALAPRAQFQIGECLFAQRKHEEAIPEFLKVDVLYAESEWAAAALYEASRCFDELARAGEARRQVDELLKRFPDSKWARLARERKEIGPKAPARGA